MDRLAWLGLATTAGLLLAGGQQALVQTSRRNEILQKADASKRFFVTKLEAPHRGTVWSADGKPLALDRNTWRLSINFSEVPNVVPFYTEISAAAGIPESEIESIASKGKSTVWNNPLDSAQAARVNLVKQKWRANGLSIVPTGERAYPMGYLAAGVVGAKRDGTGTDGLEGAFERSLAGSPGIRKGLVDRSGAFLPMRSYDAIAKRKDGVDVFTTVDTELQSQAVEALREAVEAHHADRGAAVIIDPKTGDILAMANWPTFDPQPAPGGMPLRETSDLNLAYMAKVEPGSIMKILTLAKALDDGKVTENSVVNCRGELMVQSRFIRCDSHHGNRAHGPVTPALAIALSCNISAATWAMEIGREPFFNYLDKLGLLDKVGLGLRGETGGSLNRNDYAQRLQLADLGFGQSITCTPLALADAFSSLANHGQRMKLRLVTRIGNHSFPPMPLGQMMSDSSANIVMKDMEGVMDLPHGTGRTLKIPGYRIAGKTGTAQKKNGSGGYVSNFVGFLPADDPKAEILVMIDNPHQGGYYGAQIAGPVFHTLAQAVIRRYQLKPTLNVISK